MYVVINLPQEEFMENTITIFGEFLTKQLIKNNMSLRELARKTGIDASNLSKIKRGVIYPPKKEKILDILATALQLNKKEKQKMIDLAYLVSNMIPPDTMQLTNNEAIPLVFRAINKRLLTKEETEKLAESIAKENSWQGRKVD